MRLTLILVTAAACTVPVLLGPPDSTSAPPARPRPLHTPSDAAQQSPLAPSPAYTVCRPAEPASPRISPARTFAPPGARASPPAHRCPLPPAPLCRPQLFHSCSPIRRRPIGAEAAPLLAGRTMSAHSRARAGASKPLPQPTADAAEAQGTLSHLHSHTFCCCVEIPRPSSELPGCRASCAEALSARCARCSKPWRLYHPVCLTDLLSSSQKRFLHPTAVSATPHLSPPPVRPHNHNRR